MTRICTDKMVKIRSAPCHPCTHPDPLDVCYTLAEQVEQVLLLLKAKVQNRLRHQSNGPVRRAIG
jgi:hypothetical protein